VRHQNAAQQEGGGRRYGRIREERERERKREREREREREQRIAGVDYQ